jgi:hypothetical protein
MYRKLTEFLGYRRLERGAAHAQEAQRVSNVLDRRELAPLAPQARVRKARIDPAAGLCVQSERERRYT